MSLSDRSRSACLSGKKKNRSLTVNFPNHSDRYVSQLTGFYFRVLKEGEVTAGDELKLIDRDKHQVKVSDITKLYVNKERDLELLQRAIEVEALPASWRDYLQKQIKNS